MLPALLLAVALHLEPNPPFHGEAATLIVETQGESAELQVDIGDAAMLRRAPDGASIERTEGNLRLRWQRAPERARIELVVRADTPADRLNVVAICGTSTANLSVEPLSRDSSRKMPSKRFFLAVLTGLALSLLMWPTFRLTWRHSKIVGTIAAISGTVFSVVFVLIWWSDYAAGPDYREGRCVITDRMLVYTGRERSTRYYRAMYAVELDGRPRIAGDGDSSGWSYADRDAFEKLRRFEIGKAYPCWWSVRDRHELLLEPRRRGITRTVLVTIAILLLFIAPGWFRPGLPRRR